MYVYSVHVQWHYGFDAFSRRDFKHDVTMFVLFQHWTNELLTWRPEDFGGIERLNVPSNAVWTPDIVLYNRRELISTVSREGGAWPSLPINLIPLGQLHLVRNRSVIVCSTSRVELLHE